VPEVRVDPTFAVERVLGVEFARVDGGPLLLDAVFPAGEAGAPRPVVLYIRGDGWSRGVRSADPWLHPYLATHGFFAASCDYRPSGRARFPAQLHDVKAAIRWLRANSAAYGIDPDRLGIWGDSAGAHLAALAGVTGDSGLSDLEGDSGSPGHSSRVQAVVWCSGASDFLRGRRDEYVERLFWGTGPEQHALMRLASPVYHVRAGAPPFLLLHGTRDETTRFEQAVALYEALVVAGAEAELVPLLGRYHNWTGRAENPDDAWRYWDAAPMALPFFVRHLRPWTAGAGTTQ
jgi:acetyl esterase/lipase